MFLGFGIVDLSLAFIFIIVSPLLIGWLFMKICA